VILAKVLYVLYMISRIRIFGLSEILSTMNKAFVLVARGICDLS
jgi:hypothetical protein